MKLGVLFSGGKDSTYAAYLAKQQGHELTCLITVYSENPDSYMFHTPSIEKTKHQAEVMNLPLLVDTTKGKKEEELVDLERVIKTAIDKYGIEGITTGALYSDYQATRIQKICDKLGLKFINPLWHKDEFQYLNELIKDNFKVIIIGTAAEGLDQSWLGREINQEFIEDVTKLYNKYKIHVAGEGGEFETFVLNCPLFSRELKVIDKEITRDNNSSKMEIKVK